MTNLVFIIVGICVGYVGTSLFQIGKFSKAVKENEKIFDNGLEDIRKTFAEKEMRMVELISTLEAEIATKKTEISGLQAMLDDFTNKKFKKVIEQDSFYELIGFDKADDSDDIQFGSF